jgi:hypothetical protein
MLSRNELVLLIGAAVGMALWYGAPWFAGQPLPWDGGLRYLAALAIAGAALEAITPGTVWPGPAGLYAGQALALLVPIVAAWVRLRLGLGTSGLDPSVAVAPGQPWPIVFQLLFLASMTLAAALGSVAVAVLMTWNRPLPQDGGGASSKKASSKKAARP